MSQLVRIYLFIYLFIGSGYIWGNQLVIDIQYFDSLPFRGESHTQVKLLQTMCGDGRMRISGKSTMCINVEECMKHCEAPFRWLWSPYKNNQLSWALFIEHSHVLEQPLYIQSGEWSSIEINMVTINHNEPNSKDFPFLCLHERFFFLTISLHVLTMAHHGDCHPEQEYQGQVDWPSM